MSLTTFGIYGVYWFYKNWNLIKQRTRDDIKPFWRALFAIFFVHQLFRAIKGSAETNCIASSWKANALAWIFILLTVTSRLPDPFWLITFFSFFPLLIAQGTVNEINGKVAPLANKNDRFSGKNITVFILGFLFIALVRVRIRFLTGLFLFENTIGRLVSLAALMPHSGNTGD